VVDNLIAKLKSGKKLWKIIEIFSSRYILRVYIAHPYATIHIFRFCMTTPNKCSKLCISLINETFLFNPIVHFTKMWYLYSCKIWQFSNLQCYTLFYLPGVYVNLNQKYHIKNMHRTFKRKFYLSLNAWNMLNFADRLSNPGKLKTKNDLNILCSVYLFLWHFW